LSSNLLYTAQGDNIRPNAANRVDPIQSDQHIAEQGHRQYSSKQAYRHVESINSVCVYIM